MENETKEIKPIINRSDSIKELATALSKFQGQVKLVKKESENPFFKSKYADLGSIIEVIQKPLSENGLSFTQFPLDTPTGISLTTLLMHISGEWLEGSFSLIPKDNTPQGNGSAITYMRRYALGAVLGIATEEDDDGNSASSGRDGVPHEAVVQYVENLKKPESPLVCDVCGKSAMISPRTQRPYCPDWKKHKAKGERTIMILPKEKTENVKRFEEGMEESA